MAQAPLRLRKRSVEAIALELASYGGKCSGAIGDPVPYECAYRGRVSVCTEDRRDG